MAYERTGDRKYYDLGKRYLLDQGFFDPLAEGQNVLTGLARVQPRECAQFRHPGIPEAGRREVFPGGQECGGHDPERPELCHRRLGSE